MEERAKAERTSTPVETTDSFGVWKGIPGYAVDAGNPLQ